MALLTRFLQVSNMVLTQFSKLCEKAATVGSLAMQTHIHMTTLNITKSMICVGKYNTEQCTVLLQI